jgi:hypothetical protein
MVQFNQLVYYHLVLIFLFLVSHIEVLIFEQWLYLVIKHASIQLFQLNHIKQLHKLL